MRIPGKRGNFSLSHAVVYSTHEYPINCINGVWIVGNHTPLELLIAPSAVEFITKCDYFDSLKLKSYVEHNNILYEAQYNISKSIFNTMSWGTMQVVIKTNKEFIYEFEEL